MSSQAITLIGVILTSLLGGGAIKAFFDYLSDRRRGKVEENTSTFRTLVEMNTLLRTELKDVRNELKEVRAELETERRKSVTLEIKVHHLEAHLGMESDT